MTVNAEVRDTAKLNRWIRDTIIIFAVYIVLMISSILCAVAYRGVFVAVALMVLILMIPLIAVYAAVAAREYHNTWMTNDFELNAKDGALYYGEKRLHVNYSKETDVLYAHDLGNFENPNKASIYMTVTGEDKVRLMDYLNDNGIGIEKEGLIAGISRYRRK